MSETAEIRLKRLRMRSWRRGTREMDLLLGPFADTELGRLSSDGLDLFESLLSENDHDLYTWLNGQSSHPAFYGEIVARIAAFHGFERPKGFFLAD